MQGSNTLEVSRHLYWCGNAWESPGEMETASELAAPTTKSVSISGVWVNRTGNKKHRCSAVSCLAKIQPAAQSISCKFSMAVNE